MKIALGCDHGGFNLKNTLITELKKLGYDVEDLGALSYEVTDDYPDFAKKVGIAIQSGAADRGIIICGSGVGACIAANKIRNVRAGLCHDSYSAHQGVEHDNMNVLCLGARIIGDALALEITTSFLNAKFTSEERHTRRLSKIGELESFY